MHVCICMCMHMHMLCMFSKARKTTNEEKQLRMSKTDKGSLVAGAVMKVSKKADTSGGWQACNPEPAARRMTKPATLRGSSLQPCVTARATLCDGRSASCSWWATSSSSS